MNATPSAPPTPRAWCRVVLDSLGRRQLKGREVAHLQFLLSCFLELDPTPEKFAQLLDRYAVDSRPDIAAAAVLLQRAWQREHQ